MNNPESPFLAEIADNPHDPGPRLIFADWLEDLGDERGELIRIEESMRAMPIYSDEYWQQKPRRNELRSRCNSDFLQALDYGQVYTPVFSDVPDDWRSRWRLIREFTERWFRVSMPDVGRVGNDSVKLGSQIGRDLSPAIIEWMAFTDDLQNGNRQRASKMLRDGRSIEPLEEHASLSLNLQSEGDVHWAVFYDDFGEDDPPVHTYFLDWDSDEESFVRDDSEGSLPVTEFALSFLMSYTYGQGGFGSELDNVERFVRNIKPDVLCCGTYGRFHLIEDRGWIAILQAGRGAFGIKDYVDVKMAQGVSVDDLPARIKELYGGAGYRMSIE